MTAGAAGDDVVRAAAFTRPRGRSTPGLTAARTTSSPAYARISRESVVDLGRLAGGVLAVHAHPDDETLSTGALLATCAAWGLPVTVVTCTRGERGEVLALAGTTSEGLGHLEGDGPALAAYREGELARALVTLAGGREGGIGQMFLDQVEPASWAGDRLGGSRPGSHRAGSGGRFEDSGMVWVAAGVAGPDPDVAAGFAIVPLDDAAGRLARVIRQVRPSVVVTYEAGGGYGHPDHVRAHQVAVRAVELAADPAWDGVESWTAELWVRVAAVGELRRERAELARTPGARALAESAGLVFPAEGEALPPVARDDEVLAAAAAAGHLVKIEVEPVLADVVAAMRAHATQIQHAQASAPTTEAPSISGASGAVLGWYALSNGVLAPIGRTETYLVADAAGRSPASVGSAE